MATVIVGIGFVAVFQMVNYAVGSINVSGERTKANYLVSMIAEGFIGYKDTIGGITRAEQDEIYYEGGKAYLGLETDKTDESKQHSRLGGRRRRTKRRKRRTRKKRKRRKRKRTRRKRKSRRRR